MGAGAECQSRGTLKNQRRARKERMQYAPSQPQTKTKNLPLSKTPCVFPPIRACAGWRQLACRTTFGPNGQQNQRTVPKDYQGFPKTGTAFIPTVTSLDTATLLPLSLFLFLSLFPCHEVRRSYLYPCLNVSTLVSKSPTNNPQTTNSIHLPGEPTHPTVCTSKFSAQHDSRI